MLLIFVIVAGIGAIVDHKYIKAGGTPSTATERRYLTITVCIVVLAAIAFGVMGSPPEAISYMAFLLASIIFCLWELARFRVRRKNPIGYVKPVPLVESEPEPESKPESKPESDFPEYI